jgi:RimJ/RimL family protein N-acetyltransferase
MVEGIARTNRAVPSRMYARMGEITELETPRLLLRGWRDEDVEPWVCMNADERVREFFPNVATREESLAAAARLRAGLQRDGYGWWVIQTKDDPAFAGTIALQPVPFETRFTPVYEIGWRLPCDAWGRGYATEGAAAVMRFAFERLDLPEVVALTASINRRSRAVMERLGMTHDAIDDFDHPRLATADRLRRHVLYRATRPPSWHTHALGSEHERRIAASRGTGPLL